MKDAIREATAKLDRLTQEHIWALIQISNPGTEEALDYWLQEAEQRKQNAHAQLLVVNQLHAQNAKENKKRYG